MASADTGERGTLLLSLRKVHNLCFGVIAAFLFVVFVATNLTVAGQYFKIPGWLFNGLLTADYLLVFAAVFLLAKSSGERVTAVALGMPASLFNVALIIFLPVANVFTEQPIEPPWSPVLLVSLLYPFSVLGIWSDVYWELNGSDERTERERVNIIRNHMICGASVISYILMFLWARVMVKVGLVHIRTDMLTVMVLTSVSALIAIYIDVTVQWMERVFRKTTALWLVVLSGLMSFSIACQFIRISDWETFHRELLLITVLHAHLLAVGVFWIRDTSSRKMVVAEFVLALPLFAYVVFLVGVDNKYISHAVQWIGNNSTTIFDGFGWLLGAMAGSAIWSALVWRFGGGYKKDRPRPNINSATLAELTGVPGISRSLGQRILEQRPYGTYADILDRVEGVGRKRLALLMEAFDLRLE